MADIDAESGRKLEAARGAILKLMQERRPRFVPAFEQMQVEEHRIRLVVPTQELREELLRNRTAMLRRIAELAGITGSIELEVEVNESIRASRPIRVEDRLKFLTDKNSALNDLRRELDLEID